ncbi:MAG: enoyl-CoA hydratase/isomerase family protein [Deltaproteobacteria bacterium]|nr:enoyl-CoA hydratase/isomerase family protein [Deltaproteobacteria bacterium]MBN2845367.1 enoyl-CoA hydratase/isomerase family protein [Deltaproteobacteria bacterium]
MAIIEWEKDDTVAIVKMNNGENRHNLEFSRVMMEILEDILEDKSVTALLITSSDKKFWSAGVDVEWIGSRFLEKDYKSIKDFLYALNDVFKKILTYPIPVIASINGHVAANGLVLACACDFRFMRADRGFARFPEVDLGIPFLPGMIEITKKGIPFYKFEELKYTAKKITAEEMKEHHIILNAFKNEDILMKEALKFAKSLNKARGILGEMKRRMNRHIINVIDKEDPEYIESGNLLIME